MSAPEDEFCQDAHTHCPITTCCSCLRSVCAGATQKHSKLHCFFSKSEISLGAGCETGLFAPVAFPHFDFRLSSGTKKNCFFSWRKPVLLEVTWILVTFCSVSALFIEVSRCLKSHWKEISWWLPTCSSQCPEKNHKLFPAAFLGGLRGLQLLSRFEVLPDAPH